jgi:hypothetical protein
MPLAGERQKEFELIDQGSSSAEATPPVSSF